MGDALHTHGGVTDAKEARIADGGLLAVQGAGALDVRTGVLVGPGATALVTGTAATGTMTVSIAAHHWVTSRGSANGPYRGALEAATTANIAAAPGSGSRIDVVYVKQQDATAGVPTPDGVTAPLYGVVTGTVGAGKPALPVGAEELATVTVAAGATSTNGAGVTIANTARITVARGAPIPVTSQAERDALPGKYDGLQVIRRDTTQRRTETWNGSKWCFTIRGTATNAATDAGGNIIVVHGAGQAPVTFGVGQAAQNSDLKTRIVVVKRSNSDATSLVFVAVRTDTSAYLASDTASFDWWAEF
jgi:hypothetical protein